jgi:hypothetical protein
MRNTRDDENPGMGKIPGWGKSWDDKNPGTGKITGLRKPGMMNILGWGKSQYDETPRMFPKIPGL